MLRELAVVRMVVEACAAPERVRRSLTLALGDVQAAWVQLRMERDALRVRVEETEAIALRGADRIAAAEREVEVMLGRLRLAERQADDAGLVAREEVAHLRARLSMAERQIEEAEQRADDAAAALGERVGA